MSAIGLPHRRVAPSGAVLARRQFWGVILFVLLLVGFHTRLNFYSIPYSFAIMVATAILLLYFDKVPLDIVRWCLAISAVGLVSMIVASGGSLGDLKSRIPSYAYLNASLYVGGAGFLLVRTLPRRTVERVVLTCLIVLLVGALLEQILSPLRDLTTHYAGWVRPNNPYDAFIRDAEMTSIGVPRPMFFSPEPSDVAKSAALLIILWYLYAENRAKLLIAAMSTLAGIVIIRSPSVGIAIVGLASAAVAQNIRSMRRENIPLHTVLLPLIAVAVGAAFILVFMVYFYRDRVQGILAGTDGSVLVRLVIPSFLSYEVLRYEPLFGAGVGARDQLATLMYNLLVYFHVDYLKSMINHDTITTAMGNAFCEMLIVTGLVGSIAITTILNRVRRSLSDVPWLFYFPTILAYWLLTGGFAAVGIWCPTFLLLAPGRMREDARIPSDRPQAGSDWAVYAQS
jgi:hypothetical protein